MKLINLSEPQLAEAAHVLSVLIQTYDGGPNPTGVSQSYRDTIVSSLTMVLDDVAQTRQGAGRPIPDLIRMFNKQHNPKAMPYTVANASAPWEFDLAEWTHFAELSEATQQFGKEVDGQTVGWVAVWDNQEARLIGEMYL